MDLEPGLEATADLTVTDRDTAIALGSGDVPVLGTPRVLALAEQAAVAAVAEHLAGDRTSVGTWVELEHLAPTGVGATVTASARLTGVDGKRLTFAITVADGDTEVARATHHRVIVSRARFSG